MDSSDGAEVSPTLISSVTDAVAEEVKAWQSRPLDALYPIVYMDCIHVKVRDSGAVRVAKTGDRPRFYPDNSSESGSTNFRGRPDFPGVTLRLKAAAICSA